MSWLFESPVDFNDSQTVSMSTLTLIWFESPVDFNDSQTTVRQCIDRLSFESPVDFNDSQTIVAVLAYAQWFESPVDFNDSQTVRDPFSADIGLRALQILMILKRPARGCTCARRLRAL